MGLREDRIPPPPRKCFKFIVLYNNRSILSHLSRLLPKTLPVGTAISHAGQFISHVDCCVKRFMSSQVKILQGLTTWFESHIEPLV